MIADFSGLAAFGWSSHFSRQVTPADLETLTPARVLAVHRNALDVAGPDFSGRVPPLGGDHDEQQATVGDWLLLDRASPAPRRLLDRRTVFKRRAAGSGRQVQLIAANVDTLLLVTSCNHDFNVARLERYLALAREAGANAVVVITKADTADPAPFAAAARRLMPGLLVETLDARDPGATETLRLWCGPGETVALVGSSGVGKSTLVNTLTAAAANLATAEIRDDDSRGRHTTTGRSLHRLPAGGWLLDTPGMRELQLTDVGEGIADVFSDIVALGATCRFHDCRHESEPGCAVRAGLASGAVDADRYARYAKLAREDARNSQALHQRRAREKTFGRMVRGINREKKARWET